MSTAGSLSAAHAPAGVGIEVSGIVKTFDRAVRVIDRLDLSIPPGQFISLLGPSGCGKSTLLRLIAGLERADSGSIDFSHTPAGSRAELAFVFQDAHLLPWRSVLRNTALPLELRGVARRRRLEQASAALAAVGLADVVQRYPAQLSGGMRMRVSLARALVTRPRLLLLDEPFAALDEITRLALNQQLLQLWRERGMTVIFVTHSIVEASYLSQRVVVLSGQPARIRLDRISPLPRDRTPALRGAPDFSKENALLLQALDADALAGVAS